MPRLLLVRHGLTEFNSARRFMGFSDIQLSAEGRRQAERLRDHLAAERIDAVYSSDLKRCLETAAIICSGRQVEVVACPELRELHYGACEGLTFGEIGARYPQVAERCMNFTPELAFPGGEDFMGFQERACQFLERLDGHGQSEAVLVVSHSGPLKVILCHLLGIDACHWLKLGIDVASLSVVQTSPRRTVLARLNDTSHLRGGGQ
jgi:alpha-ribazole phosphatase